MLKRPLVFVIISFILGIILVEIKRTILIYMVLLFFVMLLIIYKNFKSMKNINNNLPQQISVYIKEKYIVILLSMCIACIIGYFYTKMYLKVYVKDNVDSIQMIEGVVKECNVKNNYVENIVDNIKINNKKEYGKVILKSKNPYNIGDYIQANIVAKLAEESANSGGFNYRYYLYSKGIYLICDELESKVIEKDKLNIIVKFSLSLKDFIDNKIENNYPKVEGSILRAILLGEKNEIDENYSLVYERAGMIHLLVVSGAHIAFLISTFLWILKILHISKNKSNIILFGIIIVYMIITGLSASVLRAGIVSIIVIISNVLKRQNDSITSLFIGMFILVINNPLVIYSVGFLLSFSGALSIILFNKIIYKKISFLPEFLRTALSVTLSAQIFTIPIVAYVFNTVYFAGIFSNLIAVPLTSAILMLGLFSCIPLGSFLSYANYILIVLMINIAKFFSGIDFFTVKVATYGIWGILLYYFYVFTLFNILKINRKMLKILTGVIIFVIFLLNIVPGGLELNFINVGHGDSIFIRTPNRKNILIDVGDKYISNDREYDVGESTVVPYILKSGCKTIDLLILTHMDSDHIGGAEAVLNNLNVKNVAIGINSLEHESYKKMEKIFIEKNINIVYVESGVKFSLDNVLFEVLTPTRDINISENNNSITLRMSYKSSRVLFMGDLEIEGEEWLIDKGINISADILKIGHHGSKTSTSERFLEKVNPKKAIISVGNRFEALPNEEVIERLEKRNIEILRTDKLGGIKMII